MKNMLVRKSRVFFIVLVALVVASCHGGSSGGDSGNSGPALNAPDATTLSGTWIGTLSRPGGLPSIGVRWDLTQSGQALSGPMTLTNNGISLTFTAKGSLAGGAASGYNLGLDNFAFNAGVVTNLPNCS